MHVDSPRLPWAGLRGRSSLTSRPLLPAPPQSQSTRRGVQAHDAVAEVKRGGAGGGTIGGRERVEGAKALLQKPHPPQDADMFADGIAPHADAPSEFGHGQRLALAEFAQDVPPRIVAQDLDYFLHRKRRRRDRCVRIAHKFENEFPDLLHKVNRDDNALMEDADGTI